MDFLISLFFDPMIHRRWTRGCLLVALALWGCSRPDYSGEKRFPLSGRVTFNGEPIDLGSIAFMPTDGGSQRVSGGYIENGAYSVPEAQGANAGKYRIEIHWQKRTGKQVAGRGVDLEDQRSEGLPAKFHKNSELTAEVSAGQTRFDFDLKSQ